MQVPILIEWLPDNGFRATAGFPFCLTAEGKTRDEVLQKIRGLIDGYLTVGREILQLEVPIPDNPWLRSAGTLDPDDPLVQEWLQIMEENRRKADNDPDFL
jgi:predicted RNase H-like HicB family nuclease